MRRFALQFYLAITTIANCNLFFVFILLVPASGTAAAPGSVAAAVCPEPKKATDTSALGNDEELPPANISATAFAKGDRVRAQSRGQGGMWVHGTIKFVNPKKKNQDRTYKVLYDDDLQFMTAFHANLEPEPEKDESSASEDAGALHGLGLGDDNDADEGVTPSRRHTRASSTQGNKKLPPPKIRNPRRGKHHNPLRSCLQRTRQTRARETTKALKLMQMRTTLLTVRPRSTNPSMPLPVPHFFLLIGSYAINPPP